MRLTVTRLSPTRALVVREPALAARILFGRTSSSELATFDGLLWRDSVGWVGRDVEAAIEEAL